MLRCTDRADTARLGPEKDEDRMQTLLQLNPPIPLSTPKGEGLAVLVIDYGPDFDLWWTVIISKGEFAGQIWTYANPEVRGVANITLGRHPAALSRPTSRPGCEPESAGRNAEGAKSDVAGERQHAPGANGNGSSTSASSRRATRWSAPARRIGASCS